MQTLWKQDRELHPAFATMNRCLPEDWFLLRYELKLQRAHARALEAAGILTADERAAIEAGLVHIEETYLGRPCPDSDAEDLHTWIEAVLTDRIGEPGRKIHTARSRNDQVATLLTMYVIDAGEALAADLAHLIRITCRRAKDWSDLTFALQTHNQFAAPGSVGFWALRYAVGFDRVRRHLLQRVTEWRRFCPLGSGAVAGSSIPLDRRIQATELGFDEPSLNALDSTCTRDECLEWLAIAAQAALHLQSFATDAIGFSQTPLGWTDYPQDFATGSSMMPNKTNPDAMELLRGRCAAVAGAHAQAVLLLKGLPSGYNRDLQCIKPVLNSAVDELRTLCGLAAAFLERLEFNADRLSASLRQGNIAATLRMEQNVVEGMSLREAHHAVAAELQREADRGAPANSQDSGRYRTIGGASPAETRRIADLLLAELEETPHRGNTETPKR